MNLRILPLFAFCLLSIASYAQVLVGPIVGPQVSWVAHSDRDNKYNLRQKPVYGFHAGAALSFRVQKRFYLHGSLVYSTKGKWLEPKSGSDAFVNKATYRYIEMPIAYTAEFITKTGKNRQFKWYLGLGPNISYLLKGSGKIKTPYLSEINAGQIDYTMVFDKELYQASNDEMVVKEVNRLQLGFNLASGVVFEPTGLGRFMVTMRYEFGHSFFSRDGKGTMREMADYEDDLKTRNQGVRVSLAYMIDLKTDQKKRGKSTIRKKTFNR